LTVVNAEALIFHSNLVTIKHNVLIMIMDALEEPAFQMGVSWAMPDRGLTSCISPPKKKSFRRLQITTKVVLAAEAAKDIH
jgi:hypothetical protein